MTHPTTNDVPVRSAVPSVADRENAAGDRMATILGWCLGLGLFAAMWAGFAYVNTFGWRVSKDHDIWNQAGGFFGGVLGPTFGFLSLMALLLTVMLQREQLSLSRTQLAESSAELARSREIQMMAAKSMSEQAHFAAISARAVALGAALEASQRVSSAIQQAADSGRASWIDEPSASLHKDRDRLISELLKLTLNLAAPTGPASP